MGRDDKSVHLENPIDESILDLLNELVWWDDLFKFLPQLCLNSLNTLDRYLASGKATSLDDGRAKQQLQQLQANWIPAEQKRETKFYSQECNEQQNANAPSRVATEAQEERKQQEPETGVSCKVCSKQCCCTQ